MPGGLDQLAAMGLGFPAGPAVEGMPAGADGNITRSGKEAGINYRLARPEALQGLQPHDLRAVGSHRRLHRGSTLQAGDQRLKAF